MSTSLAKVHNRRKTVFVTRKSTSEDEPSIIEDETDASFTLPEHQKMSRGAPTAARIGSGRLKKTKVPFDPSHSSVPRRRQTIAEAHLDPTAKTAKRPKHSPTISEKQSLMPTCIKCNMQDKKKFVNCKSCKKIKIHLECLKEDCSHFSEPEENHWECDLCRSCVTCYESSLLEPLFKCYSCFSSFHMSCHQNSISRHTTYKLKIVPKDRFRCSQCESYKATMRKISEHRSLLDKNKIKTKRSHSPPESNGIAIKRLSDAVVPKAVPASVDTPNIESKRLRSPSHNAVSVNPKSSESLIPNAIPIISSDESCATNGFASQSDTGDFAGFDVTDVQRTVLNLSPPCQEELLNGDDNVRVESARTISEHVVPKPVTNGTSSSSSSSKEDDKGLGWTPFGEISETVPNPGEWTTKDVFEYFRESFPTASLALLEQDIDGSALLLIKRRDILNLVGYQVKLPNQETRRITLGTALKIYAHVVRLQTRSNDVRLSWMNIDKD